MTEVFICDILKILKEQSEDVDTLLLAAWALDGMTNLHLFEGTLSEIPDLTRIKQGKALAEEAYKYCTKAIGAESHQVSFLNFKLF